MVKFNLRLTFNLTGSKRLQEKLTLAHFKHSGKFSQLPKRTQEIVRDHTDLGHFATMTHIFKSSVNLKSSTPPPVLYKRRI